MSRNIIVLDKDINNLNGSLINHQIISTLRKTFERIIFSPFSIVLELLKQSWKNFNLPRLLAMKQTKSEKTSAFLFKSFLNNNFYIIFCKGKMLLTFWSCRHHFKVVWVIRQIYPFLSKWLSQIRKMQTWNNRKQVLGIAK